MRANASISVKKKENVCDVESHEVDDGLPLSKIHNATAKSYKLTNKCDYPQDVPIFPESNAAAYRDFSPVDLFELLFDENLIDIIIEKSNLYAHQKNLHETYISEAELEAVFSILIISGYLPLSSIKPFWKNSNVTVYNSMSRTDLNT